MLSAFSARRIARKTEIQVGSMVQVSEFDRPTDIITHCPTLGERFPFHLDAFLYQKPPNPTKAAECHQRFRDILHKETGAKIWTVREILNQLTISELRSLVIDTSNVKFKVVPSSSVNFSKLMTREYINYSLSQLKKDYLIDLLMLHPSISINLDDSSTGFSVTEIPVQPLSNLCFTRDQQISTDSGVVIGRFTASQRKFENSIMQVVWNQLGVKTTQVKTPAELEGGDFFPISKDLALLGVGLRTNMEAARQLMDQNLINVKRLVVIEDSSDLKQQRAHLDTIFTPLDESACICVDAVAQDHPNYMRIAREFVKHGNQYLEEVQMPFGKWLRKEGFTVVLASEAQQKNYFLNLLHLGKDSHGISKIMTIHPDVEKTLKKYGFKAEVIYLDDFSPITAMYGGIHCSTQVLRSSD